MLRNEGMIKVPKFEWDSPLKIPDYNHGWNAVYESIRKDGHN